MEDLLIDKKKQSRKDGSVYKPTLGSAHRPHKFTTYGVCTTQQRKVHTSSTRTGRPGEISTGEISTGEISTGANSTGVVSQE